MFFRVPFAMLDYEKPAEMVFLENIAMLLFWVFTGMLVMNLLINKGQNQEEKANPLLPVVQIMAAVIIGFILSAATGAKEDMNEARGWQFQTVSELETETQAVSEPEPEMQTGDVSERIEHPQEEQISPGDISVENGRGIRIF